MVKLKNVIDFQGGRCAYCERPIFFKTSNAAEFATFDHIVPKSKGGSSLRENLVACCLPCNHIKRNRDVFDIFPDWNPARWIKKDDSVDLNILEELDAQDYDEYDNF